MNTLLRIALLSCGVSLFPLFEISAQPYTPVSDLRITGIVSPAQITADQDDYTPTGLAGKSVARISSDALRTITGLGTPAAGRVVWLHNVGAQDIVLADEGAGSTAALRFALVSDLTLSPDMVAELQYDATSARWRLVGISAGGGGGGTGDIEAVGAGAGLTGGGTTGSVSLAVGAGAGIVVNADDVALDFADAVPLAPGTAATGSSAQVAREDHVHPRQTAIVNSEIDAAAAIAWTKISKSGAVAADVGAAAASHTHALVNITDAGDAAALDVGTGAGTVAAGDHAHTGVYQPLDAQLTSVAGLAYAGNAGKVIKVNATADGFELADDNEGAGGGDSDAIHDNVSGEIAAVTAKATPVAADMLLIEDSAATNAKKSITVGALETALEGVLDLADLQGAVTDGQIPSAIARDSEVAAAYQTLDADLTAFAALTDPNADRLLFWDDSAGTWAHLTLGANLSVTGTTLNASGGGSVAWGAITGTLSDQTDLQSALDAKQASDAQLTALAGLSYTSAAGKVIAVNGSTDGFELIGLPVSIGIAFSDTYTAITAGAGKVTFRMPHAMTLSDVRVSLGTAQASGSTFTVDINEGGTTVLSTKVTVDNTEKTSTTAATAAVISDSALADDAEMTIDVDQVGDGTAVGGVLWLIGTR